MSLGGYSLLAAGDEEAVLLRKDLVKHVGQMSQYKQLRGTPVECHNIYIIEVVP